MKQTLKREARKDDETARCVGEERENDAAMGEKAQTPPRRKRDRSLVSPFGVTPPERRNTTCTTTTTTPSRQDQSDLAPAAPRKVRPTIASVSITDLDAVRKNLAFDFEAAATAH
eukprot:CAMPEP_0198658286 /NCGR_PEP_ID=MMETSP1467-20131203/23929_1 /TAXON_ID=1462469 /ORGANISM="unid. sp., Strain CCMP2135" /LENGTH=114 /DNA_ID=CAMNT_0044394543 /DNA_START=1 /DNA_END=345 /DNA_ORIENTATION=+